MSEEKNHGSFEVESRGIRYTVKIKFIQGQPADRYGWKKDHIRIWLEFFPSVGSCMATGIELPIANYTKQSLITAIVDRTSSLIPELLDKWEEEKANHIKEEKHKADLDHYANTLENMLEG